MAESKYSLEGNRQKLLIGVAVVAIVTAFISGYFIADDRTQVKDLENEIATLTDSLGEETERSDDLTRQLEMANTDVAVVEGQQRELRQKLRAERSMNGKGAVSVATTNVDTDLDWGEAGTIASLTIRPTDLTQTSSSGNQAVWVLTMEIKNDGSQPESPVCGSAGADLVDNQGRTFTGESVLYNGSASCDDDLQPGLTATYKAEFKLPSDAKLAAANLYGDSYYEEDALTWSVPK